MKNNDLGVSTDIGEPKTLTQNEINIYKNGGDTSSVNKPLNKSEKKVIGFILVGITFLMLILALVT